MNAFISHGGQRALKYMMLVKTNQVCTISELWSLDYNSTVTSDRQCLSADVVDAVVTLPLRLGLHCEMSSCWLESANKITIGKCNQQNEPRELVVSQL